MHPGSKADHGNIPEGAATKAKNQRTHFVDTNLQTTGGDFIAEIQHEDFGERIGGAKKDLWKLRGLLVGDLEFLNEREADKFVKKDNVWKKPNYQALVDSGVPVGVAFFIQKVRDSVGTGPVYLYTDQTPERRQFRQKEYIETVRQIQELTEGVKSVKDAMSLYERFFVANGYLEPRYGDISGRSYTATKNCGRIRF